MGRPFRYAGTALRFQRSGVHLRWRIAIATSSIRLFIRAVAFIAFSNFTGLAAAKKKSIKPQNVIVRIADGRSEHYTLIRWFKGVPHNGFGEVLNPRYTAIGWLTHGHTGGDVPLTQSLSKRHHPVILIC